MKGSTNDQKHIFEGNIFGSVLKCLLCVHFAVLKVQIVGDDRDPFEFALDDLDKAVCQQNAHV